MNEAPVSGYFSMKKSRTDWPVVGVASCAKVLSVACRMSDDNRDRQMITGKE